MAFQVLGILAGLLCGWLKHGSVWALTNLRLRLLWLLPFAFLLQYISIQYLSGSLYEWSIVISYVSILVFCLCNIKVPGIAWTLAGTASNFLVMAVNGLHMPAYLPAVHQMDPRLEVALKQGTYGKSIAMTPHTHLNFLGDIFSIKLPPESLVSIGDIIFSIGLVILLQHAMCLDREGTSGAAKHPQVAD